MNIYFLHDDPDIAATLHVDDHIKPMYLEALAMLTAAVRYGEDNQHVREHPMTRWVGASRKHFGWCWRLAVSLAREHEHRFDEALPFEAELDRLGMAMGLVEDKPWRNPPRCIHDWCKIGYDKHMRTGAAESCHVASYRLFYSQRVGSRGASQWTNREVPEWYADQLDG